MDEEYDRIDELFGSNDGIDLALSFSRISDYDRNGPKALDKKTFVDNYGAKIGSIVDDWLFNREKFDDLYFVFNGNKPTATLGKLVDIILENYTEIPNEDTVFEIIETNGFWKRSKPETVKGYFDVPEFWDYLTAMFKGREQTLITTDEMALSQELAHILKTHQYSKRFFETKGISIPQYKFTYKYKDCTIRGILDLIKIDHEKQTVEFIDLKTGAGNGDEFIASFIKYRYYFQAALYLKVFRYIMEEMGLVGYTLLPFKFLYIGRKEKVPFVYEVSEKWIDAAFAGFTTQGGYDYKGIDELMEEIKWHWQNKVFNMPKEVYENNGQVSIKDNFFSVNTK